MPTLKRSFKHGCIAAALIALISLIANGFSIGVAIGAFITALFVCGLVALMYNGVQFGKNIKKSAEGRFAYIQQQLNNMGADIKYQQSQVYIDEINRHIYFSTDDGRNDDVHRYDFSDVRSWQDEVNVTETQYTNKQGAYSGSKTTTDSRFIIVSVNNPEHPNYKFLLRTQEELDLWMGRLGALFNG